MAFAPLLRQRAVPLAVLTTGLALYPKQAVFADSLENSRLARKPIYDAPLDARVAPQDIHDTTIAVESPTPAVSSRPTPTGRLAAQIKETRLFMHKYAVQAEDGVNNAMTKFLQLESDFTSTIVSLAPPKGSNEKVLPGAVYVLVAAMAGSIVTKHVTNRMTGSEVYACRGPLVEYQIMTFELYARLIVTALLHSGYMLIAKAGLITKTGHNCNLMTALARRRRDF